MGDDVAGRRSRLLGWACWGAGRHEGPQGPPQPTLAGSLALFQGWTHLSGLSQGLALQDSHQLFFPHSVRKQQPHFLQEGTSHRTSTPGE